MSKFSEYTTPPVKKPKVFCNPDATPEEIGSAMNKGHIICMQDHPGGGRHSVGAQVEGRDGPGDFTISVQAPTIKKPVSPVAALLGKGKKGTKEIIDDFVNPSARSPGTRSK